MALRRALPCLVALIIAAACSGDDSDAADDAATSATTPECVDVGDGTEVRAGDFVVGNFVAFREGWDGTVETSKLYYIPDHPDVPQRGEPWTAPPLSVIARPIDPEGETLQLWPSQNGYARASDGTYFYATGTVLPTPGRWRLHMKAGSDRGCLELTLTRRRS